MALHRPRNGKCRLRFWLNPVADDHASARAAKEGDDRYRHYFRVLEDRATVDR